MTWPEKSPMRSTRLHLAAAALLASAWLRGSPAVETNHPSRPPAIPEGDRIRLAEAYRLAAAIGDGIWPGWGRVPFATVLVAGESEYFVRHPHSPAGSAPLGRDALLGSDVFVRARTFSPGFLATFPVEGISTVVVGTADATGAKSPTDWVVTLLHEHFHQLQTSRPGYFARVDSLGLARGDKTGMWMLDYAFPYDSARVRARFAALTQRLDSALATPTDDARAARWAAVRSARGALHDALAPDDDRYLAFQMWQEGVARYTELAVARFAAEHYTPTAAFAALPDFVPYATVADRIDSSVRAGLRGSSLERGNRVAFYPAGAAYALMLDRMVPEWRTRYFDRAMSLEVLLPPQ